MESFLLAKDIIVIKNAVSDPERMYRILQESKNKESSIMGKWSEWIPWGEYSKAYPLNNSEWINGEGDDAWLIRESMNSFWNVIKDYKEKYFSEEYFNLYGQPFDIPTSWEEMISGAHGKFSIGDILCAETISSNPEKDTTMDYHNDRRMWVTPNFPLFNYNIYINDDYDGGEISFIDIHNNTEESTYIDHNGETKQCIMIDDPIVYKMKSGDGMLFRTDHPHAVWPMRGKKYYIRHFLMGSPLPQYTEWQNTLSEEDLMEKLKEEEKRGFENIWNGQVYANKEDIKNNPPYTEKTKVYVLKSGNSFLVPTKHRYSYTDDNYMAMYEVDPLYDYNTRKEPIKVQKLTETEQICKH